MESEKSIGSLSCVSNNLPGFLGSTAGQLPRIIQPFLMTERLLYPYPDSRSSSNKPAAHFSQIFIPSQNSFGGGGGGSYPVCLIKDTKQNALTMCEVLPHVTYVAPWLGENSRGLACLLNGWGSKQGANFDKRWVVFSSSGATQRAVLLSDRPYLPSYATSRIRCKERKTLHEVSIETMSRGLVVELMRGGED